MEQLIQIKQENGRQLVDARELHQFLESKQDFSTWIKSRIEKYCFNENQDFSRFHKKMEANNATMIEYALTIDMSKELCMIENNQKGQQARRYFIAMEKKAKTNLDAITRKDLAKMLYESEEEKERLEQQTEQQQKQLKEAAPKIQYYEDVLQSQSIYGTNQIAKELGMSAITLNKKLHRMGIQYKQNGTWLLYHKYQDKGYTKTKTHVFYDINGDKRTNMQTVWTEEGRLFIHKKLNQ